MSEAEPKTEPDNSELESAETPPTTIPPDVRLVAGSQLLLIGTGLAGLLLATYMFGLLMEMSWARNLWIRPQMPFLGLAFVSSIAASFAAPLLWIAYSGELAALRPLAVYGAVSLGGISLYLFTLDPSENARSFSLFFGATALVCAGLIRMMKNCVYEEPVPTPAALRWIFRGIAVMLVPLGVALTFSAPNLFPFPLSSLMSVLYGWIFIGAGVYVAWGARSPVWQDSRGQLIGLLAYDLVLIKPYAGHLANVQPENRLSLILYLAAISATALLSIVMLTGLLQVRKS